MMQSLLSAIAQMGADVRLLARGLGIDMALQPLLPPLDLSVSNSWPGGSISAAAGDGDPIAELCLPDGNIWFGGGLAMWDVATIAFDVPVQLHAVDITAPSTDARPDIIGLDHADAPAGPWTPLLTHDVGSLTATQRIAVPATTAACWRVSVIASAGAPPALFAIQLYGHNQ
ncbi:hypothetical protein [Rivihabitans pingtungensis]|uniref:Uncharacterized protein n=1 Tax=Rivihabitans pingtungensis TaxID=1054498 RepID=A0A318LBR5_9NEIS|nr:hypothetical protein [Rivihabitans pingtungensis]PXX79147.1 hypothetical protein DFR34_10837 [Rivihabitans pingtungensis]